MTSILKVSEIQDPTNSNTAISIDATGKVTAPNLTSPGHVIQVKNTTSNASVSMTGQTFVNSGVYVDFTPLSASSTIVVHAQGHVYRDGAGHNFFRVINQSTTTASLKRGGRQYNQFHESVPIIWKDTSHNSTTQRRYEIQIANRDATSETLNFNDGGGSYESGITVFEIAG